MENSIIIRFGEIYLKGNNKSYFEKALINNIKLALKSFEYKFNKLQSRYIVSEYSKNDENDIIKALCNVCGIHSLSIALKVPTDIDEIKKSVLKIAPDSGTFRVSVRRADKKFSINSTLFASNIGAYILENKPNLVVDLHSPLKEIDIDIREEGVTFIFCGRIMGRGGMPVGTAGKAIVLLSGGIDSPVAAYQMCKRGMNITGLHFHSFPYTSQMARDKVVDLANIIARYGGNFQLIIAPFTEIQESIHKNCPAEYMITIMRRFMMRIAQILANKFSCGAIITGESLGQVASQTLESITVTNAVVNLPVFRPLIGMDKSDIIKIAENIDTYSTSIKPYEDCCTVFLPQFPVIKPKLEFIENAEKNLDIDNLIERVLKSIEIVNISQV